MNPNLSGYGERITLEQYKSLSKPRKKRHKYGAKKTIVDGIKFDSAAEAKRYTSLKSMEKSGMISKLVLQPKFSFCVDGQKMFDLIADFQYETENGSIITEDVKGYPTPIARLKRKLVEADRGIKIHWVDSNGNFTDKRKKRKKK